MSDLTLVTGFWSPSTLRRRAVRSAEVYVRLFEELLLFVDAPIVAFIDPPLVSMVEGAVTRAGQRRAQLTEPQKVLPAEVRIVPRALESVPYVRNVERYVNLIRPGNSVVKKDSIDFSVLTWAKPALAAEVARENRFSRTHTAWIDFGVAHVTDLSLALWREIEDVSCGSEKIRLLQRMASHPDEVEDTDYFYAFNLARIAGGFFSAPNAGMVRLAEMFEDEIGRMVGVGRFALEEQLLAAVETRFPDEFERWYGDYFGLFTNIWKIRRDLETILGNLEHCRNYGLFARGADIQAHLRYAMLTDRLRLEPYEALALLDDGVACLRGDGQEEPARDLARLAAGMRATSATMRYTLQLAPERSASLSRSIKELGVEEERWEGLAERVDLGAWLSLL